MEDEKEIQEKINGDELLHEKALADDLELDKDLENLPI